MSAWPTTSTAVGASAKRGQVVEGRQRSQGVSNRRILSRVEKRFAFREEQRDRGERLGESRVGRHSCIGESPHAWQGRRQPFAVDDPAIRGGPRGGERAVAIRQRHTRRRPQQVLSTRDHEGGLDGFIRLPATFDVVRREIRRGDKRRGIARKGITQSAHDELAALSELRDDDEAWLGAQARQVVVPALALAESQERTTHRAQGALPRPQ